MTGTRYDKYEQGHVNGWLAIQELSGANGQRAVVIQAPSDGPLPIEPHDYWPDPNWTGDTGPPTGIEGLVVQEELIGDAESIRGYKLVSGGIASSVDHVVTWLDRQSGLRVVVLTRPNVGG